MRVQVKWNMSKMWTTIPKDFDDADAAWAYIDANLSAHETRVVQ